MAYPLGFESIVNLILFFGLNFSGYLIFYFSARISPQRQVSGSIFILSLGLSLVGLSHLFRIGMEVALPVHIMLSSLMGGILLTLAGVGILSYERFIEVANFRKRYEELIKIISNLKKKYYRQEISEEDLRAVYSSLLKELAELEVKLKETKAKH